MQSLKDPTSTVSKEKLTVNISSSLCRPSISEFGENTNKKTFRSKIIPQCCTHPLEQAARQASPSKTHCILSAAAEITFVFNCLIPSSPSPLSLSHVFLLFLSPFPPPPPPFHLLCQAQRAWDFPAWSQAAPCKWTLTLTQIT